MGQPLFGKSRANNNAHAFWRSGRRKISINTGICSGPIYRLAWRKVSFYHAKRPHSAVADAVVHRSEGGRGKGGEGETCLDVGPETDARRTQVDTRRIHQRDHWHDTGRAGRRKEDRNFSFTGSEMLRSRDVL